MIANVAPSQRYVRVSARVCLSPQTLFSKPYLSPLVMTHLNRGNRGVSPGTPDVD